MSETTLRNRLMREQDRRCVAEEKAALYRETLGEIVAAKNDLAHHDHGGPTLILNAEEKMRAIAARALIGEPTSSPHHQEPNHG